MKFGAAVAAVAVILFLSRPASFWEFDEPLFAQALHHYDPVEHHPPPPGYPLFIAVAKVARLIAPSDFAALAGLSLIASLIGFALLAAAFGRLTDPDTGLVAALLFYLGPAMLVHATLPISEPGALALLAAALFFLPRSPSWFAAFAALTVGWRIQFSIFIVPLVLTAALMQRTWRERVRVIAIFAIVCLLWFVPLTVILGGVQKLIAFETGQAKYLAEHDADVSRSGWTAFPIISRFLADPWGPPLISIPLLACAAAGIAALRRNRQLIPIAVAAAAYIALAFAVMDPADGVRYAIPFTLAMSLAAGAGILRFFRERYFAAVAVFAAASIVYTSSLLVQRSTSPSPAADAVRIAQQSDAVVLYELPLWPHATYWLADHQLMRVNDGLQRFFDAGRTPLLLYADGRSAGPNARNFRWAPSDAYRRLTRNHYRVVSITPMPMERRFKPVRGVYAPEREPEGDEWHWLDSDATIQLPSIGADAATVRLGLPAAYPFADNVVDIYVDSTLQRRVRVPRGTKVDVAITLPQGAKVMRFASQRVVRPSDFASTLSRDPRRLAVRLHDLEWRLPAAGAARRAA